MTEPLFPGGLREVHRRGQTSATRPDSESHAGSNVDNGSPDVFLFKLRQYFHSQRTKDRMNHEAPPPTQLESDEDIRRVQAEIRKATTGKKSAHRKRTEMHYRPTSRAAVATLVVCDDGKDTGETIRIRGDQFFIGRSEGDLQLSHDEMVSSRHAAITRQNASGKARIVVTDLQSRNGLFVRVTKAPLAHKAEVLIGGGHYRLEIIQDVLPETADMVGQPTGTRAMDGQHTPGSVVLCEIVAGRAETKIKLDDSRYEIGRDRSCEIRRPDDPFTAAKHAVLNRTERGTWVIENQKTLNGIWLKMPQIVVGEGKSCEFRIGEQRIRLRFGNLE